MAFWYTKRSINISVRVCSILRFVASLFTTNGWAEGAGLSAQLLLYTMRCYVHITNLRSTGVYIARWLTHIADLYIVQLKTIDAIFSTNVPNTNIQFIFSRSPSYVK